jgi:hypothetical protein
MYVSQQKGVDTLQSTAGRISSGIGVVALRLWRERPYWLARTLMGDLKDPRLIYLKGFLFLVLGLMAAAGLIAQSPTLTTAILLALAIWSFCRLYYFMFYVIETYIPNLQVEKEREQAAKLAQEQADPAGPEAPSQTAAGSGGSPRGTE